MAPVRDASAVPTYDDFAAAFHRHRTRNPNARIHLGVCERLGELPDPSLAEARSRVAEARSLLAGLDMLPRSSLDFDEDLDLDLARLTLEAEIHDETYTWNGRDRLQQTPSAGDEIGDGIFQLFVNDPRPAEERLADIAARLEAVPGYLDALADAHGKPNGHADSWYYAQCHCFPDGTTHVSSAYADSDGWVRGSS